MNTSKRDNNTKITKRDTSCSNSPSEITGTILKKHTIELSHKPFSTLQMSLTNIQHQFKEQEKSKVVYTRECKDCPVKSTSQTGK